MIDYKEFLIEKYKKVTLTKEELADEIGVSARKIADSANSCSNEIPQFKRVGQTLVFPIGEVAKWLSNNLVEVA